MNLTKEILHQIDDPALLHSERAKLRCELAKQLEWTGDYEGARQAMGELWQRVGEHPTLEGLDRAATAEVLLRAGALTGLIGSARQIEGAQEAAKDLISESLTTFRALQKSEKVAEAQVDLAICYWREGAFDEARVMLRHSISQLTEIDGDLRAVALLRSALVETSATRYSDALRILIEAIPLFESSSNEVLKGKFHNEYGMVLKNLGTAENREDYIDRALIEYAAASFHFEQAGHMRNHACVENNLGFLLGTIGKFTDAHEHLDRAQALFSTLKDSVHLAQVDETRARVLLSDGRVALAEKLAGAAVQALENGGEQALLAEALTTHGVAMARLGRHQQARLTLQSAVEVAEQAGDTEGAGHAALTIIMELGQYLSNDDLSTTYERATERFTLGRPSNLAGAVSSLLTASRCAVKKKKFSTSGFYTSKIV
ncbi:MAG: hypothetical protein LC754_14720 [Acidobacteria bacterium]|nr:hypothetical protein [Acidobacteriota bacterium]